MPDLEFIYFEGQTYGAPSVEFHEEGPHCMDKLIWGGNIEYGGHNFIAVWK